MQTQETRCRLPLTHSLKLPLALSIAICVLTAASSVVGLVGRPTVYPTEDLVRAFLANDIVNLLVGLPILLLSLWLARSERLAGLLLWPGALVYTVYNFLIYVLAVPPSWAFLMHLLLVALSWLTLSVVLAVVDHQAVGTQLADRVPARLSGGILAALGALFALRAIGSLAAAITSGVPLSGADVAVNAADVLISPMWIAGGVLLWKRTAYGYVIGLGLLFQACMLFVGLIAVLLLLPALTGAPLALVDVIVVAAMSLISFVPFIRYLRGVSSVGQPAAPN